MRGAKLKSEPALNGYDRIAPYYDRLAKLFFGRSIVDSQLKFLNRVNDRSNVLILGGGSGWILQNLLKGRTGLNVWYLEASYKMLQLSQERMSPEDNITFIHGRVDSIPKDVQFDVVIANFFLDQFSQEDVSHIVVQLRSILNENGFCLVADFQNNDNLLHRMILKTMYLFFHLCGGIRPWALPEWEEAFLMHDFVASEHALFYKNFIRSVIFRAPS